MNTFLVRFISISALSAELKRSNLFSAMLTRAQHNGINKKKKRRLKVSTDWKGKHEGADHRINILTCLRYCNFFVKGLL